MPINSLSSKYNSRAITVFPSCIPSETYGTTLFWAEEYWAFEKIRELENKYPNIDFSGIIDPLFKKKLPTYIKKPIHEKILGTKSFNDITKVSWEDNRHIINIATSHVPSRFIAKEYWRKFGDNFGIITLDAHLDLSYSKEIHGAWITKELANITTVIGGWADTNYDFEDVSWLFPFIEPNVCDMISNRDLHSWLRGKKIYLSIDLDYYPFSQIDFLGYSNFWHRNKIIGHSMTIKQMLAERNEDNHLTTPLLLGESLGFFPNLENFTLKKKESLKKQTSKILIALKTIKHLCRKNSATLLCIDFVEYSPICDWHQLTIIEFVKNYPNFKAIISS
ncbi:MAG: hypothetical protein ACFFAE_02670 [Candidatus Hodarchaeota archaeon]